jgi:hypothetical protein
LLLDLSDIAVPAKGNYDFVVHLSEIVSAAPEIIIGRFLFLVC